MEVIVRLLIYGLALGSVYALVALGFVLIYNAARCINFAHGEFAMLAAYIIVSLMNITDINYIGAFVITLIIMALLGAYVFEPLVYRPLKSAPMLSILVATLGASLFLQNAALLIWSPLPISFYEPFGKASVVDLGIIKLVPQYLLIIGVMLVMMVIQNLFFKQTLIGKQFQAVGQDKMTSSIMGINVASITKLTFAYGAILAAIAGILVSPIFIITPALGRLIYLKALAASIAGGFGSIPGAILGGLIIGVSETFLSAYISSLYRDGFAFLILIIVLMVRPQGIFGEKISLKV